MTTLDKLAFTVLGVNTFAMIYTLSYSVQQTFF